MNEQPDKTAPTIGNQWEILAQLVYDLKKAQTELQCLHGAYVTQLDIFTEAFKEASTQAEQLDQTHVLVQTGEVTFLSVPLVNELIKKTLLEHAYVYISLSEDVHRILAKLGYLPDKSVSVEPSFQSYVFH